MKKRIFLGLIYVIFIVFIVPSFVVFIRKNPKQKPARESFETVKVYVTQEDKVVEMDTSQYLKEVVGAEMPAAFNVEALKAQAVAARTYLCAKKDGQRAEEHKGAYVCTDYNHCKAWKSEADLKSAWEPDQADDNWRKISNAVESTAREIVTYNSKPISAVFHSTSSGRTENAEDVWEFQVPYLKAVESKGDEQSPKFNDSKVFDIEEFKRLISANIDNTDWNNGLFSDIQRSESGGIKTIRVGNVEIKGTTLRKILDLRSTNAELTADDKNVTITTKGYGHGVGMSQYGANFMANSGSDYKAILLYYYQNTMVELTK